MLLAAWPVLAQTRAFTPDPVDLAAAKKEGGVTWYTSTPVETAQKIANFSRPRRASRSSCSAPGLGGLRRFMQEIDARRVVADVLTISDPAGVSVLIKRDLLVPFRPGTSRRSPTR